MSDKKDVFHVTTRGGISINPNDGSAVENPGGGVYTAMCDAKEAGDDSINVVWVGKETAVSPANIEKWSATNSDWANVSSEQKTSLIKGEEFFPVKGSMDNGLSVEVFAVPTVLKDFARQNTLDFLWGPGGHGFTNLFSKNKKNAVKSLKNLTFKRYALKGINQAYQEKRIDYNEAAELSAYVMLNKSNPPTNIENENRAKFISDKLSAAKVDLAVLSAEGGIRIYGDETSIAPNVKKLVLNSMKEGGKLADYPTYFADKSDAMNKRLAEIVNMDKVNAKVSEVNESMALDIGFRYQATEAAHTAAMMLKRMEGSENPLFFSQDYDNEVVPYYARGQKADLPIGMFRHIPILSVEEMNEMRIDGTPLLKHPGVKEYFVRVFSSADVIGCQTARDAQNLSNIMTEIAGKNFKKSKQYADVYEFFGKKVKIKDYPIGINPQEVRKKANAPCEGFSYKEVEAFSEGKSLCFIGGCRADYTKGVDEAIEAADIFLAKVKKYETVEKGSACYDKLSEEDKKEFEKFSSKAARDTVFYIQVQPTRGGHEDFDTTAKRLGEKFAKLEEEFPGKILTKFAGLPHAELMAVMKRADIKLDLSIKDGMALVPKEYNAAQYGKEEPGIAIVSDGMGVGYGARQINKEIEEKFGIKNAFPVVDNPVSFKSHYPDKPNLECVNDVVNAMVEVIQRPKEVKQLINKYINQEMEATDLKWWNQVQQDDLQEMSQINQKDRAKEMEAFKQGRADEFYKATMGASVDASRLVNKPDGGKRIAPVTHGQKAMWIRNQLGYTLDMSSSRTVPVSITKITKPKPRVSNNLLGEIAKDLKQKA